MSQPQFPVWAVFTKLMIRKSGRRTRVYIEIPTGASTRARRLQKLLGAGRVEEGTVLVEGRELPAAMHTLGFPVSMVVCVLELQKLRGVPGTVTPDLVLEQRDKVIERLRTASRAAQRALR